MEIQELKQWQVGVDEVGRGPVAGPVCVGLVVLPVEVGVYTYRHINSNSTKSIALDSVTALTESNIHEIELDKLAKSTQSLDSLFTQKPFWQKLRDSKKTTAKFRKEVAEKVGEISPFNIVLQASSSLIDEYGIAVCIRHLLAFGLLLLSEINPEYLKSHLFLDGTLKLQESYQVELLNLILQENLHILLSLKLGKENIQKILAANELGSILKNANLEITEENFGDDKFLSIALASNLAKQFRDEIMIEYSKNYPEYYLQSNMGYGTAKHITAIKEFGFTPIHRRSFLGKYLP